VEISSDQFNAELTDALAAARSGDDVIITEQGVPVARLSGVVGSTLLAQLHAEGLITPAAQDRAVPRLPQAEAAKDALSSLLGRLRR